MANRGVSADQDPIFVSKIRQKENKMLGRHPALLSRAYTAPVSARPRRRKPP